MAFQTSDIHFYLSGGTNNINPSNSLGGLISNQELGSNVNSLFSQVTKQEMSDGSDIYRCIYILNESTDTLTNVKVSIEEDSEVSTTMLGVATSIEVQQVLLGGTPTGGTFILRYTTNVSGIPVSQNTDPISFSSNVTTMANNIETELNALSLLSGVSVEAVEIASFWYYTITFSDYRDYQLLAIQDNSITGTSITLTSSVVTEGNPVNGIASSIGYENQSPNGITFIDAEEEVDIGTVESLDAFAIWLKRSIPTSANVGDGQLDTITIRLDISV